MKGVWLPNVHGVIQTEDGASVLFSYTVAPASLKVAKGVNS